MINAAEVHPDRGRVRFGRWMAGVSVVVILTALVTVAALGRWGVAVATLAPINGLLGAGFGALAWAVLPKQPRNGAVWTYAWASLFGAVFVGGVLILILTAPMSVLDDFDGQMILSELPLSAAITASIMIWAWIPVLLLPLTLGLLLFPDGRLVSPRWRWVGVVALALMVVSIGCLWVLFNPWSTVPLDTYDTPLGMVSELLLAALSLTAVASAASLVVRYRRSGAILRRQIRWIAAGGVLFVACHGYVVFASGGFAIQGGVQTTAIYLLASTCLVGSFWIAITRYRLYDIDVVISKTLTYGALAAFITGVYVLIVVVVGELAGGRGETSFGLSVVATAAVAIAFQPVRGWVEKWANRLVYGKRATPYEVLARFSHRAEEESDEDVLGRIPRLVVDGTGAAEANLWVVSAAGFDRVSTWPEATEMRTISGVKEFEDPVADESLPVFHDGELLGGISVVSARGSSFSPPERELLENLAGGLGLTLRNTQLTSKLRRQVKDLQRSRDRVVSAADEARRGLERDLDSGPQQQLVAVKVKLGPVRMLAEKAGAVKTATVLTDVESQAAAAIQAVRDFAAGIYPPLLGAEGLAVALGQETRKAAVSVELETDGIGRYPRDVESAVYFSVLEALQNTAKYAEASRAVVKLAERNGALIFEVRDDGNGFDSANVRHGSGLNGIGDRIDTIGGTWDIASSPSHGTVVSGSIPVKEAAAI